MIDIIVSALPFVESGKLRALAVTGAQPTSRLPGVPTVAESGYPGFAADQWYGLFAPAATPEPIPAQDRGRCAHGHRRAAAARPDVAARRRDPVHAGKPFAGVVKKDWQRWQVVAKATGAQAHSHRSRHRAVIKLTSGSANVPAWKPTKTNCCGACTAT